MLPVGLLLFSAIKRTSTDPFAAYGPERIYEKVSMLSRPDELGRATSCVFRYTLLTLLLLVSPDRARRLQ